jgi:hypothetical protein
MLAGMEEDPPEKGLTRRQLLRGVLVNGALLAAAFPLAEGIGQGLDLWEQHETWREASRPNPEFFARHEDDLSRLTLGASFAPEQWSGDERGQRQALAAAGLVLKDLGIRELRLGLRWRRVETPDGQIDLRAYKPLLEYCLGQGASVCLNVGPIKTFRWPEDHAPRHLLRRLQSVRRSTRSLT